DAVLGTGAGQRGVLGKEAVTGVQRVASGAHSGRDDLSDVEVGSRPGARQLHGFVGAYTMRAGCVVLGMNGHGRNTERRSGGQDAHGDLAAVGAQQLARHWLLLRRTMPAASRSQTPGPAPRARSRCLCTFWVGVFGSSSANSK